MNRIKLALALPAVLSLALTGACRDSSNSNVDGGNNGADAAGGEHTIFDVQNDSMPVGTTVTVRGVVVTAIDTYGARTGGVYVQEPDGGAFSGVYVFLNDTSAASLSVGDLVDVVGGVKDEFALSDDTTGRTLTEISPPDGGSITITKVGDGTLPTPPELDPWELAASDDEAEKWEGVPITFNNVRVNSAPRNVSMSDPLLKEMNVTGPFAVSSSLTELADTIMREDCYESITGIGDYFFSYKILPRSAADLVGGGTNCLAAEEGDTACDDGMDNDYDGFSDCEDFSCIDSAQALCTTDTNVVAVQDGTIEEDTIVNLPGVVVTAIAFNGRDLWVKDAGAAAVHNGVYVYRGGQDDLMGISVGSIVDVSGQVQEFALGASPPGSLTEIAGNVTVSAPSGTETPTILTGVSITDAKTEPYEGVLVTLTAAPVLSHPNDGNPDPNDNVYEWTIGTAGNELYVDDTIYRASSGSLPTVGGCVTITGVMSWHPFEGDAHTHKPVILPLSAGDIQTVTCP